VILFLEGVARRGSCANSKRCYCFSKALLENVVVRGITSANNCGGCGGDVVCCLLL
jgi:hypothetical protein